VLRLLALLLVIPFAAAAGCSDDDDDEEAATEATQPEGGNPSDLIGSWIGLSNLDVIEFHEDGTHSAAQSGFVEDAAMGLALYSATPTQVTFTPDPGGSDPCGEGTYNWTIEEDPSQGDVLMLEAVADECSGRVRFYEHNALGFKRRE
jgi:hypothetical protein